MNFGSSYRCILSYLCRMFKRYFPFIDAKNPTPHQLAIFAALFVAGIIVVLMLLVSLFFTYEGWFKIVIFIGISTFSVTYAALAYVLDKFIYRRIKVIYKIIQNEKTNGTKPDILEIDLNRHILDEVHENVEQWAEGYRAEVAKLRQMETFRREFLGNVSHELKTPVFNIIGYLDALEDMRTDPQPDPKRVADFLERAIDNTQRIAAIIDDLNSISRFESSAVELTLTTFDLHMLVDEVYDDLRLMADQRSIRLRYKTPVDVPILTSADREGIRQVLTNLVTNAIKYGKTGGYVSVGFYDMYPNWLVEVGDNGIGIDQKNLQRVFERFFRADVARTRAAGGTGLGLSIIKHIIEAHRQTVHVRSTPGIGSTFSFTLEKAIDKDTPTLGVNLFGFVG